MLMRQAKVLSGNVKFAETEFIVKAKPQDHQPAVVAAIISNDIFGTECKEEFFMGLWDMAKSAGKAAGNAIAEKAARDREKYEEFDEYETNELESKLKSSWYSAEDKMIIRKVLRDKQKK